MHAWLTVVLYVLACIGVAALVLFGMFVVLCWQCAEVQRHIETEGR